MSVLPCKLISSTLIYSIPFVGSRVRVNAQAKGLKDLELAFVDSEANPTALDLSRKKLKTVALASTLAHVIKLTVAIALCYFSPLFILFAIKFAGQTFFAYQVYQMHLNHFLPHPLGRSVTPGKTPEEREAQVHKIESDTKKMLENEKERIRQKNICNRIWYAI